MAVFQWTEMFSVHVELFDIQHRDLFRLSGDLHKALHKGSGKVVVGKILQRLIDATTTHFADEELAMALKEYPALRQHRDQHQALLAQLTSFQEDYRKYKLCVGARMMPFLQRWLVDHIMQADKKYELVLGE
jgi:hemerythrin-like metal-binding protein